MLYWFNVAQYDKEYMYMYTTIYFIHKYKNTDKIISHKWIS